MNCGACGVLEHPFDKFPEVTKEVNAIGGFNKNYGTYNSTCNAECGDHPHLRWGSQEHQQTRPSSQACSSSSGISL
ncbi:retrotransposon gag protein [Cucumis melo var. makuwa]|uniref:Retrotransposon gag protein n=1 Tax=Cucumis melo var. makuwa TaxID=1194695 RepID=A0A5D3E3Z5_CUCMM|nr:retrotransposon gag protein [Cucumis melo var. makuwa]